ncbi:hypothetical protein [Singulisphaera sp. GP187]|uniref:hypothetical protein n=1 Tax=Singulisphaera sp. GP187 TaxID=1882752 RepID=UPI0009419EBF|nr:hypothetical protein [Singulisphaera sp. GP187]
MLENTGPRGETSPVRYWLDNTEGFPSGSYFPFSPTPEEELATDWEEWKPPGGQMPRFAWD